MKKSAALLVALCMLFSLCGCNEKSQGADTAVLYDVQPIVKSGEALTGGEPVTVAANQSYSLTVIPETGYFEVKALEDGYTYSSYPADIDTVEITNESVLNAAKSTLNIEYGDKINRITAQENSYSGSIKAGGYRVYATENGFVEYYNFPNISITVPVAVTLDKDGITARVLMDEVEEKGNYILTSVSLLSHFGAGAYNEDGYIIVPDGSGAVINFSNGKHTYPALKLAVYGSDVSLGSPDLSGGGVYMPVFGIKRGGHAVLGIISKGEAESFVNAAVTGNKFSYNRAYASFTVRNQTLVGVETTSVGYSNKNFIIYDETAQTVNALEVKYMLLSGQNTDYSSMARCYGDYLFGSAQQTQAAKSLLYLNTVCSVNVEQNILGVTTQKAVTTASFNGINDLVSELYNDGVENLQLRLADWSKSDISNAVLKNGKPLSSIGGGEDLLALSNTVKRSGEIYGAVDIYKIDPSNKYGVRQINKQVLPVYPISLNSREYDKNQDKFNLLSPLYYYKSAQALIADLAEYKMGVSLTADDIQLYSDFGADNYARRQRAVEELKKAYSLANKEGCAVAEYKPNAYAVPYMNSAFYLGGVYAHSDIEDYPIPFYQLAVAPYLNYSYEPVNLAVNSGEAVMRAMEYGAGILYTVICENADRISVSDNTKLYNCEADKLYDGILQNYKVLEDFYGSVGERLLSHTCIADNVYISEYTNGKALFNYSDKDFNYYGTVIEAGGFSVLESGEGQ